MWLVSLGALAIVLWCWWATSPRAIARRREARERERRRLRAEARESRLEEAGVRRTEMDELTRLVDTAIRAGAPELANAELDDLLDAYAASSIAVRLAELGPTPLLRDDGWTLSHEVRTRSRTWHARIAVAGEQRDELAELIRLYVARALTPEIDHVLDPDAVDRCLALLDAEAAEEH